MDRGEIEILLNAHLDRAKCDFLRDLSLFLTAKEEELVSTDEMATVVGVSRSTFRDWYQTHPGLKSLRVRRGRSYFWPVDPVRAWKRNYEG